jgi:DNA-binding transcriptional regulator GbsR (MarR family)
VLLREQWQHRENKHVFHTRKTFFSEKQNVWTSNHHSIPGTMSDTTNKTFTQHVKLDANATHRKNTRDETMHRANQNTVPLTVLTCDTEPDGDFRLIDLDTG